MTRQAAIRAKCEDCIYDPANTGTVLAQIEACDLEKCALHEYRPVTRATAAVRLADRKKTMSPGQLEAYEIKARRAKDTLQNG